MVIRDLVVSLSSSLHAKSPTLHAILAALATRPASIPDILNRANFDNRRVVRSFRLRCNICTYAGTPIYVFARTRYYERLGVSVLRENIVCSSCRASSRQRALLHAVTRLFETEEVNTILDTDDQWPGSIRLAERAGYQTSTFDRALPSGSYTAKGIRNENLLAMSFESESLDMLISSDVQEHIYDISQLLSEVHRVLRPAGRYIFTTPFVASLAATRELGIQTPGGVLWHGQRYLHGDPRRAGGIPAFWLFGGDLQSIFREHGFVLEHQIVSPPDGIEIAVDIFVAQKARP